MRRASLGDPPGAVLAAWGLEAAALQPIGIGLINRTWRARWGGGPDLALQRLHPVFAGEVNLDIDAVTRHLESRGLLTPRLVPTRDGRAWLEYDGVWRALTWVEGAVRTELRDPATAAAAGRRVGIFHRAVADLEWEFRFTRAGVHDTARHLARLAGALEAHAGHPELPRIRPVAEAILEHAAALPPLPDAPRRVIHGDLKVSNLLFDEGGAEAVALVDLDTLGRGLLAHEMGDAFRSWCNPAGESAEGAAIDVALFEAAVRGWAEPMAGTVEAVERDSLALGTETIALELASRFATDALEDTYFGWDEGRFPSRSAHNRVRAASQLSLAGSVRARRGELEGIVRRAFPR